MAEKPKEYRIETFIDMVECTNPSNLDAFIADLKSALNIIHLAKIAAKLNNEPIKIQNYLTWIDDGENKMTLEVSSEQLKDKMTDLLNKDLDETQQK